MTTISSPRATTPNVNTPPTSSVPSTRSSISLDRPVPTHNSTRRNRSALRDYYNLSSATSPSNTTEVSTTQPTPTAQHEISESDQEGFNAKDYVERLVEEEGLAKLMKVESNLLSDIRGLDGERKALVYDNYSKLIDATETIGRVREMLEVETLTGQKKDDPRDIIKQVTEGSKKDSLDGKWKLDGLVAQIVEIATRGQLEGRGDNEAPKGMQTLGEADKKRNNQRETVRWVLDTPRRLKLALQEGRSEDAHTDWAEIEPLLSHWKDVEGAEDLRSQCEKLFVAESTTL